MKKISETDSASDSIVNEHDKCDSEVEALFLKEFDSNNIIEKNLSVFSNKVRNNFFVSFIPNSNDNNKISSRKQKRMYYCSYEGCDKQYKSKENLNLHIKNKHKGLKPYKCFLCSLSFSHRNGKRYHERMAHTNFLPYKCCYCSQSFSAISSMKAHQKISHKSKELNNIDKKNNL